jgi:hypothetical protein
MKVVAEMKERGKSRERESEKKSQNGRAERKERGTERETERGRGER